MWGAPWREGVVEDRGGGVRGPHRIDLYYRRRTKALRFGRRTVECEVR